MISQLSEFLACLVGWRAPWFVSLNVFAAFFEPYDAAEQRVSEFLSHFYNIKGMKTAPRDVYVFAVLLQLVCSQCVEPIWLTCGSQSVFVRLWCNKCTKCSASCFLSLLSVSSSPLSKPWLYLASVCSSPVADQFTRQQWHHCSDRSTGARCRSNNSSYASRERKLSRPVVCLWWTRLTVSALWNLSVFTCSLFLFKTYLSSRRRLREFVICAFCQKGVFELWVSCFLKGFSYNMYWLSPNCVIDILMSHGGFSYNKSIYHRITFSY